ncbi:hypothetical protein BKA70DRAFT_1514844 [Coprinopsis sp. MPI-PUGE-AT-0042]|nr:hypothetical protein BKA70DRAFT_1514844 [Coprinopsis sp. MPI-PUGE-AT-0042]
MHLSKTFSAFSAFPSLSVYAAPLPGYNGALEGQAQIRDTDLDILFVRELLDLLEERGPGVQGFGVNKLPPKAAFKTATGERFTGVDVYQTAKKAMEHVQSGTKDRGYPKEGSGFKKCDKNDPTKGLGKSFHFPLLIPEDKKHDDFKMKGVEKDEKKPSGDKLGKVGIVDISKYPGGTPGNLAAPTKKLWPGANRLVLHQKPGSERWDLHVGSHDPKKPIPEGTGAKSNPHDESQTQDPARLEEEGFREVVVAGPFACRIVVA